MPKNLLDIIKFPSDVRKLPKESLPQLAKELREFIIDAVSTKGGHLGASLGVVELTIALHYVFDTPNDLLVWDVGHQAYGHKILTGRKDIFYSNRKLNGISGFPKRSESIYDAFGVGHSSTSISAALGMAIASELKNDDKHHIAVIGDASIASGMAFEALNHAGDTNVNLLVILNDNAIGIDPSVGALKDYLEKMKSSKIKKQYNIFEALHFKYSGIIDGHNLEKLCTELQYLKKLKGIKFLHISTIKGKGLQKAEENQVMYHAPAKFDKVSGDVLPQKASKFTKFQDVFGKTMVELAEKNNRIVAVTPAMLTGSSLIYMKAKFPERTFDVGIAEQHAVTLSAGMATEGFMVFCHLYSTFSQRAYDQIIHDVALQNLPVIFCLDRAGLVGNDGATHHGVFDIAFLRCIPNIIIAAPRNEIELRNLLYTAQLGLNNPIAIRYPRGIGNLEHWCIPFCKVKIGTGICLKEGEKIAILSVGNIADNVTKAINLYEDSSNIAHYDMRFIEPLDESLLHQIFNKFKAVITIEDGIIKGGFGTAIVEFASENNYFIPIKRMGVPNIFIDQGSVSELYEICKMDIKSILKAIKSVLH